MGHRGHGATLTDKDIIFDASADAGALARAEWIKFMALFFNEEERANLYFDREKRHLSPPRRTRRHRRRLHRQEVRVGEPLFWQLRPRLHDVQDGLLPRRGDDTVADADSVSAGTYTKTFADKAAFVTAADYDVAIDETDIASPANANADKAAVLAKLDVVESDFKTDAILLRVDRHLGDTESTTDHAAHTMDWYESATPRPALVLADLAHQVWPDAFPVPEAGCARYFRNIFSDTITKPIVNGKAQCDDWSAAESEAKCLTNAVLDTDPSTPLRQRRTGRREASRRHRRRRHRRRDALAAIARARENRPNGRLDRSSFLFPTRGGDEKANPPMTERAPDSLADRSGWPVRCKSAESMNCTSPRVHYPLPGGAPPPSPPLDIFFLFPFRSRGGCAGRASRRGGDEKANPPTIRTRPPIDPSPIDRAGPFDVSRRSR